MIKDSAAVLQVWARLDAQDCLEMERFTCMQTSMSKCVYFGLSSVNVLCICERSQGSSARENIAVMRTARCVLHADNV